MHHELSEQIKKDTRGYREKTSKAKSQFSDFARQTFGTLCGDKAIWVVEDDSAWVKILRKNFKPLGISIVHKLDMKNVSKALATFQPRLVILDREGIPDFDAVVDEYGHNVIICTGSPELVDLYVKGSVLAVFHKENLQKMVDYITKFMNGENPE